MKDHEMQAEVLHAVWVAEEGVERADDIQETVELGHETPSKQPGHKSITGVVITLRKLVANWTANMHGAAVYVRQDGADGV